MQKYILTAAFILASFVLAQSQNVSTANKYDIKLHPEKPELSTQNKFSANCFQVGEMVYSVIENAIPNSSLQFYSTIHGGKLIAQCKTDDIGFSQMAFSVKAMPGFTINRLAGNAHDGFVEHFIEKEFVLESFEAQKNGTTISLNWKANASSKNQITFEILKSTDGKNFTVIHSQLANNSEQVSNYNFTETFNATSSYRLRIIKNGKTIRYTTSAINSAINSIYNIYPTLSSTTIHIDSNDDIIEPTPYYIINVSGEILQRGTLDKVKNEVAINELTAGIYIIQIGTVSKKFIKE
ncbi:MAG: hypothetical protein RIQ33_1323 [Bacteroidota bacterium]|jgi:hypothetical protein